jgi:hypothetical protein
MVICLFYENHTYIVTECDTSQCHIRYTFVYQLLLLLFTSLSLIKNFEFGNVPFSFHCLKFLLFLTKVSLSYKNVELPSFYKISTIPFCNCCCIILFHTLMYFIVYIIIIFIRSVTSHIVKIWNCYQI